MHLYYFTHTFPVQYKLLSFPSLILCAWRMKHLFRLKTQTHIADWNGVPARDLCQSVYWSLSSTTWLNPLNAKLNPICHLLALLVLQLDLMLPMTNALLWLSSVLEFGYINTTYARFVIFMALLLRVKVVWNVMLYRRVVLKVSKEHSAFTLDLPWR